MSRADTLPPPPPQGNGMTAPEWTGVHEVPGILLVRLMSRCNEKCVFCMVADEIAFSDDLAYEDVAASIARQPQGTQIEFFGGEPTIYPRFLDLLRLARERGHRCSIASNVRIFHSSAFTDSVAELGAPEIYIRTSIYGDGAEVHDRYTATRGSYVQTLRGIANIVAAGFDSQVNVVILRDNVEHLVSIVEQVHDWGVPRIKFGNLMSLSSCQAHAVPLSVVRPRLEAAVRAAEARGLGVTVEKTPVCAAAGRIDLMSTERRIYHSERVYDDAGRCRGCLVRRWCDGVDPDYPALFGFDGIARLETVPRKALAPSLELPDEPELLRMHCVEIADGRPDDLTVAALYELSRRIEARHGCLAVFPREYVSG
jgi:molybdenum cofactor biosynthesis enzyme MoaA